jgi:hypothetical protein
MTGSLARPAAAGQNLPATPALLPSGYLLAALAPLLVAPPTLASWLAGAWIVRCGWMSPGALRRGGRRTEALALLLTGPSMAQAVSWAPSPPSAMSSCHTDRPGELRPPTTQILACARALTGVGPAARLQEPSGSATDALCLVELRGFEPLTPCMPYTDQRPHHGRYGCRAAGLVVRWAP